MLEMEQKHPVGTKDDAAMGAERTATVPPVWLCSRITRLQTAKCAAVTQRGRQKVSAFNATHIMSRLTNVLS